MTQTCPCTRILVWDDEISPAMLSAQRIEIVYRTHADYWARDLDTVDPAFALLDNDMGSEHQQGWQVLSRLRRKKPFLVVFTISRNVVATMRMIRDDALPIDKGSLNAALAELETEWDSITDGTGALDRSKCLGLGCIDQRMLALAKKAGLFEKNTQLRRPASCRGGASPKRLKRAAGP